MNFISFENCDWPIYLNMNALHLSKTDIIPPPIIELRGPGGRVIGHGRGVLQRTAIFQIGRDPRRAKGMVANRRLDSGGECPPAHHGMGIGLRQGIAAQLPGAAGNGPEQGPLGIRLDAGPHQVGMQVLLERVMAGHLVPLAAFLAQPHPQPVLLPVHVFHLHRQGGPDTGKRKHHQPNQRTIPEPDRRAHVNAVQQRTGFGGSQDRRLALPGAVAGPTHRGRRVGRNHLPGDQPVKQVPQGGQALLDRGR